MTHFKNITRRLAVTAGLGLAAFMAPNAASALTLDFDVNSAASAIAEGEVIDFDYAGVTVYTYNNATPDPTLSMGVSTANTLFNSNALVVSNNGDPIAAESAGGHFIFAFDDVHNSLDFDVLSEAGDIYVQANLDGNVALAETINIGTSIADYSFSDIDFDTIVVAFTGGGALDNFTYAWDDTNVGTDAEKEFAATPEPVTATLGLMALSAVGLSTMRRRTK